MHLSIKFYLVLIIFPITCQLQQTSWKVAEPRLEEQVRSYNVADQWPQHQRQQRVFDHVSIPSTEQRYVPNVNTQAVNSLPTTKMCDLLRNYCEMDYQRLTETKTKNCDPPTLDEPETVVYDRETAANDLEEALLNFKSPITGKPLVTKEGRNLIQYPSVIARPNLLQAQIHKFQGPSNNHETVAQLPSITENRGGNQNGAAILMNGNSQESTMSVSDVDCTTSLLQDLARHIGDENVSELAGKLNIDLDNHSATQACNEKNQMGGNFRPTNQHNQSLPAMFSGPAGPPGPPEHEMAAINPEMSTTVAPVSTTSAAGFEDLGPSPCDLNSKNIMTFGVQKYIKGQVLDESSDLCGLCSMYWVWTYLGPEMQPKFIQELRCISTDSKCISSSGVCKPRCTHLNVRNSESGEILDIARSTGCECQVLKTSRFFNIATGA